jgi:hypothetical protein
MRRISRVLPILIAAHGGLALAQPLPPAPLAPGPAFASKLAFAPHTQAECARVRLDDPGGPMEHVPAGNQADLEACQSFIGAKLFDALQADRRAVAIQKNAQLHRHDPLPPGPPDHVTDPWSVYGRLCTAQHRTGKLGDGGMGSMDAALDTIRREGSCSLPDGDAMSDRLVSAERQLDRLERESRAHGGNPELSATGRKLTNEAVCVLSSTLDIPRESIDAAQVSRSLESGDELTLVDSLLEQRCSASTVHPDVPALQGPAIYKQDPGVSGFRDSIDAALLRRRPSGVGLCSTALDRAPPSHGSAGVETDDPRTLNAWAQSLPAADRQRAWDAKCAPHATIMMGREWRNGRCMYLLQNSWGPNWCLGTPRAADCDLDSKGNPTGSVWLEEADLGSVKETESFP